MMLKVMVKPMRNGELTPLLCDEHGEPLPGQTGVTIHTAVDDLATVTVTFGMIEFAVDGGSASLSPAASGAGDLVLIEPGQKAPTPLSKL